MNHDAGAWPRHRRTDAAIAYVHVHRGARLGDAVEIVKARRLCVPYLRALERCYGAV